jgi:hypothetical protein
MITEADIGWGAYRTFEGPFYRGKQKFLTPANPDFLDKTLTVLTATEGGTYDAINMYDRCILSVGLIQWCEAHPQCSVSNMLGRCIELDPFMFDNQLKKFPTKARFYKNKKGQYRFHVNEKEVETQDAQRLLFFGSPSVGGKGTWTPETTLHAKKVAAWFANIWEIPLFRSVQGAFTKAKIEVFAMPEARKILFNAHGTANQDSWAGALRAAFYSFAGNLPAVANRTIQAAAAHPDWTRSDDADKFRIGLQAMTFTAGVDIYPHRYEAIAPVLNRIFNIQAPLKAAELKVWGDAPAVAPTPMTAEEQASVARANKLVEDLRTGNVGMTALEAMMRNVCDD